MAEVKITQENFEKAGKLRDKITEIKEEIARLKSVPSNQEGQNAVITEQDVAEVISKWTNIPLTKLTEGEAEKLLNESRKKIDEFDDQIINLIFLLQLIFLMQVA